VESGEPKKEVPLSRLITGWLEVGENQSIAPPCVSTTRSEPDTTADPPCMLWVVFDQSWVSDELVENARKVELSPT
jgi:hypothetical protein